MLLIVDRKLVKIPVMTIPYNIKLEGLTEKITENFEKFYDKVEIMENGVKKIEHKLFFKVDGKQSVNGKSFVLTGSEAGKLGSIIFNTVNIIMTPLDPLKRYFKDMIKIVSHLNEPIY